jgi:hypothetical protein
VLQVESIGDAYMVTTGAPVKCEPLEAAQKGVFFFLYFLLFCTAVRAMAQSHVADSFPTGAPHISDSVWASMRQEQQLTRMICGPV